MSRLIIIDQSLKGLGGHHFDYVQQVTQAAATQNLEVLVVAHHSFSRRSPLEHYAKVVPHFRQTTYCRYSLLAGLRAMHRRPLLHSEAPKPRTNLRLARQEELESRHDQTRAPSDTALSPGSRSAWTGLARLGWPAWQNALQSGWQSLTRTLGQLREPPGRHRAVNCFAQDCQRLFPQLGLLASDHIFFTTLSDLELAGLLIYWLGSPESYLPRWHLQFHFDVFHGRVPDYRKQYAALDPLRCLFEDVDRAVPAHQIHYYATTAAIADQYQRLASRPIQELAYPINSGFKLAGSPATSVIRRTELWQPQVGACSQGDKSTPSLRDRSPEADWPKMSGTGNRQSLDDQDDMPHVSPLPDTAATASSVNFPAPPLWSPQASGIPIVVAGGVRAEKGQKGLREIWSELKQSVLDPGWGFLVCQRPEKMPWYKKRFRVAQPTSAPSNDHQVQYLPHPLATSQYQELIRTAGIGLLTYDPTSYANRRAGIFGEYLAAGIPTLVPSGTWMAQQLAQYQPAYHRQLREAAPPRARWTHANFDWTPWNVPAGQGSISFDGRDVPAYGWSPALPHPLSQPLGQTDSLGPTDSLRPTDSLGPTDSPLDSVASPCHRLLNVRFHWVWPKETGTYCRVELLFYDRHRQVISVATQHVGHETTSGGQSLMFEIPAAADHFRLGLSNAYHERNATIQRLLVDVLDTEHPVATGTVGLTYDHPNQIPARLLHLCQHHAHYRRSAQEQAPAWFAQHAPLATVQQLLDAAGQRRWVA